MANASKFLEEIEKQKKKKKEQGKDTSSLDPITPTKIDTSKSDNDKQVDAFFNALNAEREKQRKRETITDIAPVKSTVGTHGGGGRSFVVESEEDEGLLDFFDTPEIWNSGDSIGRKILNVGKSTLGTVGDLGVGAAKGVGRIVEGVLDAGAYGVAAVQDALGEEQNADKLRRKARRNAVDEAYAPFDDYLDQYSVFGRTMDAGAEALGQIGAIVLTGGLAGAAGLGSVGTTVATTGTMGLSSFGSATGEAYKGGAETGEAELYGSIAGAADAITELLSGGLGKAVKAVGLSHGLGGIDDIIAKKLSSKITNTIAKNAVEFGVKATGEGLEEVLAGTVQAVGKNLTYMSEEDLGQIIADENLLEQFVVGAMASGVAQVPSVNQANKSGTDYITGRTQNEQAVVDRVVEQRVKDAEEKADGKKLSNKEIQTIEEEAVQDLERGRIDIATIEEVLGGEEYRAYQDEVKEEDALRKEYEDLGALTEPTLAQKTRYEELHGKREEIFSDERRTALKTKFAEHVKLAASQDRLSESYAERARRAEYFAEDVGKYKSDAAKKTVQNLIDAGIANNTNRTHEMAETVAKIADDKGIVFNFTNNAKIKAEGKSYRATKILTADGSTSTFALAKNLDADFAPVVKVGDEVMQGGYSVDYGAGTISFDTVPAEGEISVQYQPRVTVNGFKDADGITINLDSPKAWQFIVGHEVTHTLEGTKEYRELGGFVRNYLKDSGQFETRRAELAAVYGDGVKTFPEAIADVVGEYLFTDEQFVQQLSVKHRNVFEKIFDEIKHLYKMVTAGSKEARDLERVKRAFEKAYRAARNAPVKEGVQHSVSADGDKTYLEAVKRGDTETAQKMVEEAAEAAGYTVKAYHGSHTRFTVFSHENSGGLFNFAEQQGAAWKYAYGGGGNRQTANEDMLAVDENGIAYEYDPDTESYAALGVWEEGVQGLKELPEQYAGATISREHVLNSLQDDLGYGEFVFVPRDANVGEYYLKAGRTLDLKKNKDEARKVFGEIAREFANSDREIDGTRRSEITGVLNRIVWSYKNDYTDFWSVTKHEYAHRVFNDIIVPELKARGYDSIHLRDDNHDTYAVFDPEQIKSAETAVYDNGELIPLSERFRADNPDVRYSLASPEGVQQVNDTLQNVGVQYDAESETVSYSLSSLEDMFHYNQGEAEYIAARDEYVTALAKATGKTTAEANRYLDSLFLVHDMIAADRDRLDYEAAVDRSAWVSNAEYGGSIDFSTLCAKRRLFTGTFDAIQQKLPDTVLNENDFLRIRNLLLEKGQESPCSMCYVEGSRAKHGVYVKKFLDDYLKTDPEWKPQIADFTSTTRLEQTRIQHPEAYKAYTQAMNALSQRKPKEASVRTDYKGEILEAFKNDTTVAEKNKNGGVRFNSFSDFEIIHALDAMQVLTDMARVGLNGQAYTKVKEFAEAFGNTGLKINLSLVAKGVDADGKLIMDETNGMNYAEALDIRSRYSENVGTVIVVFNDAQLKAALADNTIDYVLPFHRSQWKKSQYAMMGLPAETRDYTNIQNDRYKNPTTGRAKKAPDGNIMPNEYWDFNLSGRENAQKYLDYINENGYIPKFDHVLNKVDGKWVLPEGAVGDGYYKLLIDFKMYDNDGWGSPQRPVLPEFNMPYIQRMLDDYVGGHQAFPVAHDVVDAFVAEKQHSLSAEDAHPVGGRGTAARELLYRGEEMQDAAPVQQAEDQFVDAGNMVAVEAAAPVAEDDMVAEMTEDVPAYTDADAPPIAEDIAPVAEFAAADPLAGVSSAVDTDALEIGAPVTEAEMDATAEADAAVDEIKTTYAKLLEKKQNSQAELESNKQQRAATAERMQTRIDELQRKYDRKKNKDTKTANNLLRQIERVKRLKSDIDADYAKRISDIEKRIERRDLDLQQDHTQADKLERAYAKIDAQLAEDRAAVEAEFAQRREELTAAVADKNSFISGRAMELYRELANLKKGVRASYELGYLLDRGYAWRDLKSTLLKVELQPEGVINPESAMESDIRAMLASEYSSKTYEIGELDGEMQDRLAELDADAEKQKADVRKSEQQLRRSQHHANLVEGLKNAFAVRGYDLDVILKEAKNLSTFSTVDNSPQRVNDKTFGYKVGEIMNDLTVNRVAQNETDGIRWLNQYTDPKSGLIAQLSRQYKIKPGSKESAAAQMYAEGFYVNEYDEIIEYGDKELAADFPDATVQANIKGLAHDPRIRQIYDETLDMINESRVRNAYPEIPKRKDYFLHFRAMNDTFSTLGLPFNPNDIKAKDLPTDMNGMTVDLKPGQPYFASAKQRKGKRTSFDLFGGLEQYLTSAMPQIYHIDDIQIMRALRNYIADDYGQAKGLDSISGMTEEEAQERIKDVFGSHLSTYAKFLNEQANVLAGKTALIDRGLEGMIGRRAITFLNTVNRQVGANMVGYNVSSSLTNFLAPVQAFAKMNKGAFVKGFAQTVSNRIGGIFGHRDNFAQDSTVMVRREGAKRFHRTAWQKMSDPGYLLMGAVDSLSTEIIARAKFNELTAKGMSAEQAHYETDKWTSRLMGDRSLGQQPQLYNSKMLGIITKFQLEVRNQLDSQFYDTIKEAEVSTEHIENAKKRNAVKAAKITSTLATLAVTQHLFGKVFESIAGYNPAFDIIEAIIKAAGWDDDEDDDDTVLDNLEQGLLSIAEDMPYYSILSGGRIPLESALPIETIIKGKDSYGNEVSRWKTALEAAPYYVLPGGYGQIKKTVAGLSMYSDDHPVAGSYTASGNLRFPVGTEPLDVAQAAIFGQYSSGNARDYFDDERKPLAEKQIEEYAAADMTIQEYWDYRDGLAKQDNLADQAEYINSLDIPTWKKNMFINNLTDRKEDIDMADYGQYGSLAEMDFAKNSPEKYALLKEQGVTYAQYESYDDKKKDAYGWAAKNPEKYDFIRDIGYTIDDYAAATDDQKDAWTWAYSNPEKYMVSRAVSDDLFTYRGYTAALNDIKADKDSEGKSISGSRKDKVVDYINGLDADYGQKIILLKSEYPTEDSYNNDIIDYLNERDDITGDEMVVILTELGFKVSDDGAVTWD